MLTYWISLLYQQAFSERAIILRLVIHIISDRQHLPHPAHCPTQTIIARGLRPELKYTHNALSERRKWICGRQSLGLLNCWALVYSYLSLSSTPHSSQCWTTSRWPWRQFSLEAANTQQHNKFKSFLNHTEWPRGPPLSVKRPEGEGICKGRTKLTPVSDVWLQPESRYGATIIHKANGHPCRERRKERAVSA